VKICGGIPPVCKNLFLEFLQPREPVVGLSQGFSVYPHEHLLLITYFDKPLTDLLLIFSSEKHD